LQFNLIGFASDIDCWNLRVCELNTEYFLLAAGAVVGWSRLLPMLWVTSLAGLVMGVSASAATYFVAQEDTKAADTNSGAAEASAREELICNQNGFCGRANCKPPRKAV